jgi:hypothetical protein
MPQANLKTATIQPLLQPPVKWLTEGRHPLPYAAPMNPCENHVVCPVCDRPMRLATVLNRAPYERTFVLQCRPCGLSTTKTVEAPGRGGGAAELRGFGWTQGNP